MSGSSFFFIGIFTVDLRISFRGEYKVFSKIFRAAISKKTPPPVLNSPQPPARFADIGKNGCARQSINQIHRRLARWSKKNRSMGLLNIRSLTAAAFTLASCTAMETRGNSAYLQQIGPTPLRFSLATASLSFVLPPSLTTAAAPTNSPSSSAKVTSKGTDGLVGPHVPNSGSTNAFVTSATSAPSPDDSAPSASASDMLVVSPQMLTEYFKPDPIGTNSASTVVVPVPVGFTPPSVKPASQATYRSP
jgi:hypothetical protein